MADTAVSGVSSMLQGSISRSIQWLDNVAMDIIEQVSV